jgi:Fe-S cluster assembly scaffold protein SufB
VEVLPTAQILVGKGGKYLTEFKLVQGRVGVLALDYDVHLGSEAVAELVTKVYGKGNDRVRIREALQLEGPYARGLVKSRVVLQDQAEAEFTGEAVGIGPYSRGHIDCTEILRGTEAKASAVPKLVVVDERAKLTHEAAIGKHRSEGIGNPHGPRAYRGRSRGNRGPRPPPVRETRRRVWE